MRNFYLIKSNGLPVIHKTGSLEDFIQWMGEQEGIVQRFAFTIPHTNITIAVASFNVDFDLENKRIRLPFTTSNFGDTVDIDESYETLDLLLNHIKSIFHNKEMDVTGEIVENGKVSLNININGITDEDGEPIPNLDNIINTTICTLLINSDIDYILF